MAKERQSKIAQSRVVLMPETQFRDLDVPLCSLQSAMDLTFSLFSLLENYVPRTGCQDCWALAK